MGRKTKRLLGVVAAIAIPYVAPQIAGTLFASSTLSATAATTITGAALGGGDAAGQDRNLNLGRTGIAFLGCELGHQTLLFFNCNRHRGLLF